MVLVLVLDSFRRPGCVELLRIGGRASTTSSAETCNSFLAYFYLVNSKASFPVALRIGV